MAYMSRRAFIGLSSTLAAGTVFGLGACSAPSANSANSQQQTSATEASQAEASGSASSSVASLTAPSQALSFDVEAGKVTLSNGVEMPTYGIGTYILTPEQAAESVFWAIEAGARLIDTAAAYNNEEGVGQGIARAIDAGLVQREELFVTTKLWNNGYSEDGVNGALERLGLDYVDLLFVHQAMGDYLHGYEIVLQAMEEEKTRSVGLSNHTNAQFVEVISALGVAPQVAQYECHPHLQRHAAQGFLAQYETQLESWFPLGGKGNTQVFLEDETILGIAQAHNKSAAQIIERWHLQEGRVIMPGSHNQDHIRENTALFDFSLSDDEMASIRSLDQNSAYYGMVGSMSQDVLESFGDYTFEA
ncbi:MAG: aldo/keto reductase [Atopobiaceae bacterium]|nr:aldo/keto reductase [Atopobiaceae bacterium]